MAFCPNCGNTVGENDAFCGNCATNLSNHVQASNATPQKGFNVFALLGMIFSIAIGGPIGLIFSIIGLTQAKEKGGKGFAIAGLIISIYFIVQNIISVICSYLFAVAYIFFLMFVGILSAISTSSASAAAAAVVLL